jgi:O-antigen/teichoic acid export membrane protein
MVSSFQSWLFLYGDNAIAGYFFGAQGLGVYSLGFNIASLLPALITSPIAAIAYPAFCALQGSGPREVGLSMVKLQRVVAATLFPLCFGMSAIAVPAVSLLYGNKWPQLGQVIQWLILMPGLGYVWTLNADAYRAIGKPQTWTKVAFINLLVLMPLLIIAARFGLVAFVVARFAGASLYPILNIVVGGQILKLTVKEQLTPLDGPLVAALLMYASVTILGAALAPFEGLAGWLRLMAIIALGAGTYLGILKWKYPDLWRSVLSSTYRIVARA